MGQYLFGETKPKQDWPDMLSKIATELYLIEFFYWPTACRVMPPVKLNLIVA